MSEFLEDSAPRSHPMHRRVVAAVAILALVLSAIGVSIAIAQAQWGAPDGPESSDVPIPA